MSPTADTAPPTTADRLRDAARVLFAERGYAGASLGEICSRVGIRKPSIYNHFDSKDALFLDLLQRSLADWRRASGPALRCSGDGDTCRERLEAHLRAAVRFAVERPHATALCRVAVSHVGGDLEQRVQAMLRQQRVEYRDTLGEFFRRARERGEVRDLSLDALVLGWLTFLDGILTHQLFAFDETHREYLEHLDEIWDQYWRGIAAEAA